LAFVVLDIESAFSLAGQPWRARTGLLRAKEQDIGSGGPGK
jgi:hypothetical protein